MNEFPEYRKASSEFKVAVVKRDQPRTDRACACVGVEAYYPVPATGYRKAIDPRPKECCGANRDGQFVNKPLVTVHKRP